MQISELQVNGLTAPLGYSLPYLTFSWRLDSTDSEQVDAQEIVVATDPNYDVVVYEGKTSAKDNQLTIDGEFLQPKTKYYWSVSSGDAIAESTFETAKMKQPWQADWVSYRGKPQPSVTFQKDYHFEKRIRSARLYCCAYGVYELEINGCHVSDEYLLPGYHSYDLVQYYQTYDVTKYLDSKTNLKMITGNSWYKGRFVFDGGQENIYGSRQKAIAELVVCYSDGMTQTFGTDDTWQVMTNRIQNNSIYDGEIIDFSKEIKPLTLTVLSDDKSLLTARLDPPVKKMHQLKPVRVFRDQKQQLILDFGQEITGWIEGKLTASEHNVKFRFGELLQDGVFYTDNLRTAKQQFIILNNTADRDVRPHFTYFGFRYVAVEGINTENAEKWVGYSLYSDMEDRFKFNSSHPGLTKLVKNIQWGQRDNSLSIPTDCSQRDERMGWTGDVTLFSNTAAYNMDMRAFYTNYLYNMALEQKQLDGSIPFFVPYPKLKPFEGINPFLVTNGASTWGDVATILPMVLYDHYHDEGLLRKTIPIMKGWVDYLAKRDHEHGDQHLWNFDQQLGDWLALDNGDSPIGATDPNLIASVYYYRSTSNLVRALKIIKAPSADKYQLLTQEIKDAILQTYYTADYELNLNPITQTGLALLLRYGLYPNDDVRLKLSSSLHTLLTNNKGALDTGFIGTPELPHALVKAGLTNQAYELLLRDKMPSWLYEVKQGATTVWERWNSILPDGRISGTEMNSLNHYAYGAIEDFLIEDVLGIKLPQGHDENYKINPLYSNQVDWVCGSLKVPNGTINVYWESIPTMKLVVDIPIRTTADVVSPTGKKLKLNSGHYEI
ncbi:alfa-l-rhamnosidase [Lactobacillus selangorensis]|uniref:alpha-L-rhamnosidase n=1 Tax=Lactobacillus selangorensis TaxID=81857 RepID=A0A0R2FQD4_9LACO|nr:alpha-L-rhamnosidase [Lactobacillus selangorensis]KRN27575.1 alfa-l-rhamnosidase [Lactobacillus selangorensis]KRN30152.1 alfa-l-rhamnosidase [Lactobacillus selangorensis]